MNSVYVALAAVASITILLLGKVVLDLASKEIQGQVERLPYRILRLAAKRLPLTIRHRYFEEWEAELDYILDRHDARPITRLFLGLKYATSLLKGARRLSADRARTNDSRSASSEAALMPMFVAYYCIDRGNPRSRRVIVGSLLCVGGAVVIVGLVTSAVFNSLLAFLLFVGGGNGLAGVGMFLADRFIRERKRSQLK